MNLFEEIKEMFKFCHIYPNFHSAILVRHPFIIDELRDSIKTIAENFPCCNYHLCKGEMRFNFANGSHILVAQASNKFRGLRCNMIITDEEFDCYYVSSVILPYLRDYINYDERTPCTISKLSICNFNYIREDFEEFKKENNIMATVCTGTGYYFENGNSITQYSFPIKEFDKDNKHILLYNAIGIDTFEYHADFVNKTKETFLVIKGECSRYDENFKNDVNIRLKIDTDVYDIYNVGWHDGILVVELFEIINNKPHFVELSSLYEDGPF